jgi:hypothetical protein
MLSYNLLFARFLGVKQVAGLAAQRRKCCQDRRALLTLSARRTVPRCRGKVGGRALLPGSAVSIIRFAAWLRHEHASP